MNNIRNGGGCEDRVCLLLPFSALDISVLFHCHPFSFGVRSSVFQMGPFKSESASANRIIIPKKKNMQQLEFSGFREYARDSTTAKLVL